MISLLKDFGDTVVDRQETVRPSQMFQSGEPNKKKNTYLSDRGERASDAKHTSFVALTSDVQQLLKSLKHVSMETTGVWMYYMFTRQRINVWINNLCERKNTV